VTALKLTKRAKIAGLASMALATTSLTVLFASHSALASTSPKGGDQSPPTSSTSYTTSAAPTPTCTCQKTPTATPTTVTPPPTTLPPTTPAPTPTPTPTSAAPAPVAVTGSLAVTG
jgi:hypothetical protein